jgi:hypothetical protein
MVRGVVSTEIAFSIQHLALGTWHLALGIWPSRAAVDAIENSVHADWGVLRRL